jgi:hypothetical protein
MANLNYTRRLENLANRRYDPLEQRVNLSESFSKSTLPENLKYLMESMLPISKKYNDITEQAATNVMTHLERALSLSFSRNYRKQGSVMTDTNIKLYSDIDLLSIISDYSFLAPALCPPQFPYQGVPESDIETLRKQSTAILKMQYDEVDDSGTKSISIFNKNLKRKVDVVFSFWYNTSEYESKNDEYYRGIYLYDFSKKSKQLDYPFAHISAVNYKGDRTAGGSKRGVRLLKTLKADSETDIRLSSFQLTTIAHTIDNSQLLYYPGQELTIAISLSNEVGKLIDNSTYRKGITSPNGTENPLTDDACIPCLRALKRDLDLLIQDCASEAGNYFTKQQILRY